MKDFINYYIQCSLSKKQVFDTMVHTLPAFMWRQGDSDEQGPYISGADGNSIQIKLWLGEAQIGMSISFRRAWMDVGDREKSKSELVEVIDKSVIPLLGVVTKKDA